MRAHNIRGPESVPQTPRPFTVLTYNIRTGAKINDLDRSIFEIKDQKHYDLTPVIEAIKSVDADIIGLQEVVGVFQADKIAKAPNMNYAYVPHGIDRYGVWWGVAILSKFPFQETLPGKTSFPAMATPART